MSKRQENIDFIKRQSWAYKSDDKKRYRHPTEESIAEGKARRKLEDILERRKLEKTFNDWIEPFCD